MVYSKRLVNHWIIGTVPQNMQLFMRTNGIAVCTLLLLPEQRELVARLQESRAASTEINELRTKFIADLQAADMPVELKKTFTEMAADPAMLREMAADVNLLQDVGENPDSFKDAMDQGEHSCSCPNSSYKYQTLIYAY
jgi:hypothetical protein